MRVRVISRRPHVFEIDRNRVETIESLELFDIVDHVRKYEPIHNRNQ